MVLVHNIARVGSSWAFLNHKQLPLLSAQKPQASYVLFPIYLSHLFVPIFDSKSLCWLVGYQSPQCLCGPSDAGRESVRVKLWRESKALEVTPKQRWTRGGGWKVEGMWKCRCSPVELKIDINNWLTINQLTDWVVNHNGVESVE